MPDNVAVITGATSGIGRWIALGLAYSGKQIVIVARDRLRAMETQNWITSHVPDARCDYFLADLSLVEATRRVGQEIIAAHPQIAILVNNAGIFSARREVTSEGHEKVLATNHLSPFVLTQVLEPALRANGHARIVTIGSDTSDKASIDPGNLELTRGWNMVRAYSRAKLAQMMTTFEMAQRLAGSGVTANVVHPGAVATSLVRTPGIIGLSWKLMAPFLLTEEQGADTPLYAALEPELESVTGVYFKDRKIATPNPRALDAELRARVLEATTRLL